MNEKPADDVKLLPCPFCGSEADASEGAQGDDGNTPWWYIECIKCSATANSIEDWNARTSAPEERTFSLQKCPLPMDERYAVIEQCAKVCEELEADGGCTPRCDPCRSRCGVEYQIAANHIRALKLHLPQRGSSSE